MEKSKRFLYVLYLFLIVTLTPLIYIFQFVDFAVDDYCRATMDSSNFFVNFYDWYLHHNGRFINALFSLLPVYEINILKIVLIIIFLATPFLLYLLIKRLFEFLVIKSFKLLVGFVTCILFFLMIIRLPSLYQHFYWYAGVTAYSISIISFIGLLYFLIGIQLSKKGSLVGATIMTIIAVGNNETILILVNFVLFVMILFDFLTQRKLYWKLFFLKSLSVLCSIILIFSPGSLLRQSSQKSGGKFLYSTYHSLVKTCNYIVEQFTELENLLHILIIAIVVYLIIGSSENSNKKYVNPFLLFLISFGAIASIIFVPFYAAGFFVEKYGRVGNVVEIIILLSLFVNLLNLGLFIKSKLPKLTDSILRYSYFMVAIALLSGLFMSKNYNDLYVDFRDNQFQLLEENRKIREHIIQTSNQDTIMVSSYTGSRTIPNMDIGKSLDAWAEKCYVNFYNLKYKKNIKSIKLSEQEF